MTIIHSVDYQAKGARSKKSVVKIFPGSQLILLFFVIPFGLFGQSSDYGNWMSYMFTGKFNDRWAIVGDYQWRNYNAFTDLQQLMFRNFAQYSFNERISLGVGYAFAINGNYVDGEKTFRSEQRPTQQLFYRWKNERTSLSLRLRSEQRFIGSDKPLFRVRMFGSLLWRMSKHSRWAVSATEEVFYYTDGVRFDQNRVFIGLSYKFNDRFRLETGDLIITRKDAIRQQLFTQLVHTFNW